MKSFLASLWTRVLRRSGTQSVAASGDDIEASMQRVMAIVATIVTDEDVRVLSANFHDHDYFDRHSELFFTIAGFLGSEGLLSAEGLTKLMGYFREPITDAFEAGDVVLRHYIQAQAAAGAQPQS